MVIYIYIYTCQRISKSSKATHLLLSESGLWCFDVMRTLQNVAIGTLNGQKINIPKNCSDLQPTDFYGATWRSTCHKHLAVWQRTRRSSKLYVTFRPTFSAVVVFLLFIWLSPRCSCPSAYIAHRSYISYTACTFANITAEVWIDYRLRRFDVKKNKNKDQRINANDSQASEDDSCLPCNCQKLLTGELVHLFVC